MSRPPARTDTKQAPTSYFVLDANAVTAKSNSDLRFSVVALGTHDGHVAWQHRLETPMPADATIATLRPLYQDGLVYVSYRYSDPQTGIDHGVVETLDPATGAPRWRREVATEIASEPVVASSTVYVVASLAQGGGQQFQETGLVEALDSQSGAVRWQRAVDATPSSPAVADGQVFVMASQQFGGHLLALSANDGSVIWDYTADAPISIGGDTENGGPTAPLVHNHLVYVQATDREASGTANLALLALNTRDGSVAWRYQTGGISATPAFNQSGDTLCVSAFLPSQLGGTSVVAGLAATSGLLRWHMTTADGLSGCIPGGNVFYFTEGSASQPGSVLALNSQDGRQLWKAPTSSPVVADGLLAPTVTNGFVGVYLAPATTPGPVMGRMTVLRSSDGKLVWQHDFGGHPDLLMDIEGDQIYNPEFAADVPSLVVYALDSGTRLWSYRLGYL
jgi:outer membrane protein assembly factor BamB